MQHVKELFTDCTDVFEELVAVKTHLAQKIEECQSAVENIQSSLSKLDATQPQVESEIKVDTVKPSQCHVSNVMQGFLLTVSTSLGVCVSN